MPIKYDLQTSFFNMIKQFGFENPDKEITKDFVYSQLEFFNIKNPCEYIGGYFEHWKENFNENKNIRVFEIEKRPFLWFENGKLKRNEIKLYIPQDLEHLYTSAKQIFSFLADSNIEHQSKIANKIRTDNIVIRVNSFEDAQMIINYVNSNRYIMEGLSKVNPFLPQFNGIGVTMDNKYSYNSNVAELIANCYSDLKRAHRLDLFNPDYFSNYVKASIQDQKDLDIKDIYTIISKNTDRNSDFYDIVKFLKYKQLDEYDQDRNRIVNPNYYLELAIKKTEKKHPGNSKAAIKKYLTGDATYFTNFERSREKLLKYVQPRDLIPFMRSKLANNKITIPQKDDELIDIYVKLVTDNQKNYNNIKNTYIDTISKYNISQARFALKSLIQSNDCRYFTNVNNGRSILQKMVEDTNVMSVILDNIDIENLNIENVDDIVLRFEETLNLEKEMSMQI